jgi:hypothetical protein
VVDIPALPTMLQVVPQQQTKALLPDKKVNRKKGTRQASAN